MCLKMPDVPGERRMSDGSEMFAPEVFIMVRSGCEAELIKENEQSGITQGAM
jgi:hypothetical protein